MDEDASPLIAKVPVALSSSAARPARRFSWQRFGGRFLVISVLAHLLFLSSAGYLIVQRYSAPAKRNFLPSARPNASSRAMEHKVQMKKQKSAMSAPPSAKRVTTTGLSKISLPAMPAMPSMNASLSPASVSGMGAGGVAPGALGGGSMGGMGGGGAGINFFGASASGGGLTGTFYDLKQTSNGQPTGMTPKKYAEEVTAFLRSNWNVGNFAKYFKGPQPLYATQILVPDMPATEGPAAFNLQDKVKPSMWLVYYKGNVSPTESGTYHFVGAGDDVLMVRFNNKLVLARNWDNPAYGVIQTNWTPLANYDYGWSLIPKGFAKGNPIEVTAGESYPMEVLIGEQPGGKGYAALLIEKEGVEYKKDARGNPILPVFRLTNAPLPPLKRGMSYPPHTEDGPLWRPKAPEKTSVFDR